MKRGRRSLLKALGYAPLWLVAITGSNALLGRALGDRDRTGRRTVRRPTPTDLPPIPWIGHC